MYYLERIFITYNFEVVFALAIISILLLIFNIVNRIKISIMVKKYNKLSKLLQVDNVSSIHDTMFSYFEEVDIIKDRMSSLQSNYEDINAKIRSSLQNIGFIRYNAFNDMGSDLSFSIALLDEKQDGFVITNIYAREESNVYAKPIVNGKSTYPLSVEEIQALDRAISTLKNREE